MGSGDRAAAQFGYPLRSNDSLCNAVRTAFNLPRVASETHSIGKCEFNSEVIVDVAVEFPTKGSLSRLFAIVQVKSPTPASKLPDLVTDAPQNVSKVFPHATEDVKLP